MTRSRTIQQHFIEETRRKTGTRELLQRILIVCEDTKSSVYYFQCLRKRLRLTATSVEVAGSDHRTQPQQVVNKAKELKDDAQKDGNPFDQVWCIIDGDYGNKITNARHSANAAGIQIAVSTPCFEYWLVLHFEDYRSMLPKCNDAVERLNKHASYQKAMKDFSGFMDLVEEAAKRAKNGRDATIYPKAEDQNPCSELGPLIDILRSQT